MSDDHLLTLHRAAEVMATRAIINCSADGGNHVRILASGDAKYRRAHDDGAVSFRLCGISRRRRPANFAYKNVWPWPIGGDLLSWAASADC